MKHIKTTGKSGMFKLLTETRAAQAAMMTLRPGQSTGEPDNEHAGSEQWLCVISGIGAALVNKRRIKIRERSLLLIEKGEIHQIKNTGKRALVTLNIYVPPAYDEDGNPRNLAKRAATALARGVGLK
jgi:mannose-6-phosphate isomerase-like protein (cupin superfamily)